jgi:hypothetical protein
MEAKMLLEDIKKHESFRMVFDTIKNHKIKSIFGVVILIGLISLDTIWTYLDGIVTSFTALAVFINIYINSRNKENELQKISFYFNEKKLNLDVTRKDISRQEIQGLLGVLMVDMDQKYKVSYLSSISYLDQIYKIQKNQLNELRIEISDEELMQFREDIYE